ncbi:MAG TPA: RNA-binding protein [Ruminococcaceae bacterium]|nr:RNA-binding protein [Oscillospiraceae bacterium]
MSIYKPEGLLIDTAENIARLKNSTTLQEAYQSGKTLEARAIICNSEHNLIVDLGCCKGIIPRNEGVIGIEQGGARDIAIISRVNKPVCFKIIGFEKSGGVVTPILSRRLVQEECIQNYIMTLKPGDIIDARVTHLEAFGCFVDIGCGIPSLIPIDAISISRISHPRDRFKTGQDIKVVVKSVDENGRVLLSHKELLGNWEQNAANFANGETVAGIVRSVEDYGVFVELAPNLAGLAEPFEGVKPGQHASVYIKNMIPEKMKIKLIIVDAFDAFYNIEPPTYFIEGNHIDRWRYSPENAEKIIETVFGD